MHLVFSPTAVSDLEEIGNYIARDNPKRAVSFLENLETQCLLIAQNPALFPSREDLANGLRMSVHGRYLILFRVLSTEVRIERIVHGARRLGDLF